MMLLIRNRPMTSTDAISILKSIATFCEEEGNSCRGSTLRKIAEHIEDLVEYINNFED
jgi:hypothetical protein